MPGGDRTGPMGRGPMTGRAAGFCGGYGIRGDTNALGRGFGQGRGRCGEGGRGGGRGWRHGVAAARQPGWFHSGLWGGPAHFSAPSPAAERAYLEDVAESLQHQLGDVKKRLEMLPTREGGKAE
jgi:hypothetical protein